MIYMKLLILLWLVFLSGSINALLLMRLNVQDPTLVLHLFIGYACGYVWLWVGLALFYPFKSLRLSFNPVELGVFLFSKCQLWKLKTTVEAKMLLSAFYFIQDRCGLFVFLCKIGVISLAAVNCWISVLFGVFIRWQIETLECELC